jgi:hypothetical protein
VTRNSWRIATDQANTSHPGEACKPCSDVGYWMLAFAKGHIALTILGWARTDDSMLFRAATMRLAMAAFLFSTLSSHAGARVALIISYLCRALGKLLVDAGRIMADDDGQSGLIGELLQFDLP